jgi:hypothetical protein
MKRVKFFNAKSAVQGISKKEDLHTRLEKLEQAMEQLPQHVDIRIENLTMQNPVLENLTFRLDKLDIKELSGALNLGNNFGVKVKPEPKAKKEDNKDEKWVTKKYKDDDQTAVNAMMGDNIIIKEKKSDDMSVVKKNASGFSIKIDHNNK